MPNFTEVQTDGLPPEARDWLTGVLTTIERLDADAYTALMTDDVELRLPDGSTLTGRTAVANALRAAWEPVASLTHHELNLYGDSHRVVHEARTETDTDAGEHITSYVTSWIDRDDQGRIVSARVYG